MDIRNCNKACTSSPAESMNSTFKGGTSEVNSNMNPDKSTQHITKGINTRSVITILSEIVILRHYGPILSFSIIWSEIVRRHQIIWIRTIVVLLSSIVISNNIVWIRNGGYNDLYLYFLLFYIQYCHVAQTCPKLYYLLVLSDFVLSHSFLYLRYKDLMTKLMPPFVSLPPPTMRHVRQQMII